MDMKYTAQEMREMAENIIMSEDDWIEDAAYMLRSAADMMERADSAIKANAKDKKCRHRDADAVLATAEFILGGKLTLEKKYEYAIAMNDGTIFHRSRDIADVRNEIEYCNGDGKAGCICVRREVGEWEEVKW